MTSAYAVARPEMTGALTEQILATKLAALEGTENAVVFSSGMAAISSTMLALLQPGDHFLTQARFRGKAL